MISVSSVGDWTECEHMAMQSPRPEARIAVAAYVGSRAHAIIAGEEPPEPPERLAFDNLTTTFYMAYVQANDIAAAAKARLDADGWTSIETEVPVAREGVTGRLDMIAWHRERGWAVIDLKTGAGVHSAWLQVGGYIDTISADRDIDLGGILHVRRTQVSRTTSATLVTRSADRLAAAWQARLHRIEEVLEGKRPPLLSPGMHCRRCDYRDCPVRTD